MKCTECDKEMNQLDRDLQNDWEWCHPHVKLPEICFDCYCKVMNINPQNTRRET